MHIGIHHTIKDAHKWDQGMQNIMGKIEGKTVPAGLKPVLFVPSTNHKTAFCVWEGESIDTVKKFVDRETSAGARNDYFEVESKNAIGLPQLAMGHK